MIPDFRGSAIDWYARLVVVRKEQPERFGWLDDVSSFAVREAVLDVTDGWKHFFEHLKAGRYERAGRPRFRSRRAARYHADQPDPIRVTDRAIKIPGVGWVRLKERGYLPKTADDSHRFPGGGKAYGLGLSEVDGRWYVSLRCEVPKAFSQKRGPGRALREHAVPRIPGRRVGVEVGVRVLGATYDGESSATLVAPGLRDDARIARFERLRKLWERRMARRWKPGVKTRDQSAGWKEASRKVAHYHARLVHVRDDVCGKFVRKVVDTGADVAVLREPSIAAMLDRRQASDARKRNALAPSVHGARMGEIRQRLEYKMEWAGGKVELAPRFEPTSKRCSECGVVRETDPAYPNFLCPACGHVEDRDDANSPKNLYNQRAASADPEADPRSAGLKPPKGDNGRGKRMARAKVEQSTNVTAPHRPGNRARPGALHSVQPNESHHDITLERLGDDDEQDESIPLDTATVSADEGNRSQSSSQVGVTASALRDSSGAIS
jgi:putative transposase